MTFGSAAKVLPKCKLKYYRISECMGQVCVHERMIEWKCLALPPQHPPPPPRLPTQPIYLDVLLLCKLLHISVMCVLLATRLAIQEEEGFSQVPILKAEHAQAHLAHQHFDSARDAALEHLLLPNGHTAIHRLLPQGEQLSILMCWSGRIC